MASLTKFKKTAQGLLEATANKIVDDFVIALKEKFELDEDDLNNVIDSFKKSAIAIEKKKRPASEYNIFIKETIQRLKAENPESTENLMKLATAEWNKHKAAAAAASSSETEEKPEKPAKASKPKASKAKKADE